MVCDFAFVIAEVLSWREKNEGFLIVFGALEIYFQIMLSETLTNFGFALREISNKSEYDLLVP